MPSELALLVSCPFKDFYMPVSVCKSCPRYGGIMHDIYLNCDYVEDQKKTVDKKIITSPVRHVDGC